MKFHVYGSMLCCSELITVQRDATQSSLSIILQVHCTCFGCQPHSSSGVYKTVTTASGTVQLPPSNVAKLASYDQYQYKFTVHVSGVNDTHHQEYTKLLTTASGTGHIFCAAMLPPTWPSQLGHVGGR